MANGDRGSNRGGEVRGFDPELTRNSTEVVEKAGVAQRRQNRRRSLSVPPAARARIRWLWRRLARHLLQVEVALEGEHGGQLGEGSRRHWLRVLGVALRRGFGSSRFPAGEEIQRARMEGEVSWASLGHSKTREEAGEGWGEATATVAACRACSCVLVPGGRRQGRGPGGLDWARRNGPRLGAR